VRVLGVRVVCALRVCGVPLARAVCVLWACFVCCVCAVCVLYVCFVCRMCALCALCVRDVCAVPWRVLYVCFVCALCVLCVPLARAVLCCVCALCAPCVGGVCASCALCVCSCVCGVRAVCGCSCAPACAMCVLACALFYTFLSLPFSKTFFPHSVKLRWSGTLTARTTWDAGIEVSLFLSDPAALARQQSCRNCHHNLSAVALWGPAILKLNIYHDTNGPSSLQARAP
jgi:hypothetical protein